MRKIITIALLAAVLGGCDVTPGVAVDKGRDMVASQLKDPDSAQFGDVFFVERQAAGSLHSGYLCGTVNARNSFGGYAGDKQFVADFSYSTGGRITLGSLLMDDGSAAYAASWAERCQTP